MMPATLRRFVVRSLGLLACLAATGAFAQNMLWEVTGLTNHAYLFGTMHAGRQEWYPLPRAVEEAMQDSAVLVVEADITNQEAMERTAAATTYTPPDNLRKHVAPEDYARFVKLLARYGLGEPQMAMMKPFMATSLLVFAEWARQGYLPRWSVDGYVIARAKQGGKKLEEIEGIEAQVALMDSLTDRENRDIFHGTLTALESGLTDEQIRSMVRAWQVGDPALLLDVARRYNAQVKGAAEFEEKFIWSRHPQMLRKIEGYLNDTNQVHFIAVGALHLVGPRGLVEELRKRGYQVKQVFVAPQGETKK